MHILKNQILQFENVLSYRTKIRKSDLNELIGFIKSNTDALNLKICGNIVATVYENETISDSTLSDIELLIPINREICDSSDFVYKPVFKIMNAVKIRYEGSMQQISQSEKALNKYISDNSLLAITGVYFSFVQSTEYDKTDNIVDIYRGVSENIL